MTESNKKPEASDDEAKVLEVMCRAWGIHIAGDDRYWQNDVPDMLPLLDAIRPYLRDTKPVSLDFILEFRGDVWVLDWGAKGGSGCRPATDPEIAKWLALKHEPSNG